MKQKIAYLIVCLLLVVSVAGIAYWWGSSSADYRLTDLQGEVLRLQEKERNSIVVERVSKQMEDIAFQQKAISDEQRERAEQQTELAMHNAKLAEEESRIARQAQHQAMEALEQANLERAVAEHETQRAEYQLKESQLARSISDTLRYRTLARDLARSSLTGFDSGNDEQACLVAYASWYFLNKYAGNPLQNEHFQALIRATSSQVSYSLPSKSSVQALALIPGTHTCVIATNYGELEFLQKKADGIHATSVLKDHSLDFRALQVVDGFIYALSYDGRLCQLPVNGNTKQLKTYQLPDKGYTRMLAIGSGTLLVGKSNRLEWFDRAKGTSYSQHLDKSLSAMCCRNQFIDLFFTDNSYAQMDRSGRLQNRRPLLETMVTAATYDPQTQYYYLGARNGLVGVVNAEGKSFRLIGHSSRITSIAVDQSILLITSYDQKLNLWDTHEVALENDPSSRTSSQSDTERTTPREWASPAVLNMGAWALDVCCDPQEQTAWVALSNGTVQHVTTSANQMAHKLQRQLKRSFTRDEWAEYVGASEPYVSFKK